MERIALILVLMAVARNVQGAPTSFDDLIESAKAKNWAQIQEFLTKNLNSNTEWKPSFDNIRSLQPPEGGKVYGEAQYAFQSSSNVDGHKTEETGGHKVINDNGRVNEFDFHPTGPFF